MQINLELNEHDLKQLVLDYFQNQLGVLGDNLTIDNIDIEVKSKQNYKSEWEKAAFRAKVTK